LGCWISPYYGSFLFGVRFETYELFISLIFHFFLGPWSIADIESVDMGAQLWLKEINRLLHL
jgi:hypothetical protein